MIPLQMPETPTGRRSSSEHLIPMQPDFSGFQDWMTFTLKGFEPRLRDSPQRFTRNGHERTTLKSVNVWGA